MLIIGMYFNSILLDAVLIIKIQKGLGSRMEMVRKFREKALEGFFDCGFVGSNRINEKCLDLEGILKEETKEFICQ
jgi:hypothetical protein